MKTCKSTVGIHFFYVTVILSAIIVLLATFNWTRLDKFTEYLSSAGTITSLVLGVLAIIYSFVSNDSIAQSSGVMRDTADSAKKAAGEVSNLLEKFKTLEENTKNNNNNITEVIRELSIGLESLENTTNSLTEQNIKFHELLNAIPNDLKALNNRFDDWSKDNIIPESLNVGNKLQNHEKVLNVEEFINRSSLRGKLLCYWCYLSFLQKKSFSVRKVFSDDSSIGSYEYGFFIAMRSADYIAYKTEMENVEITEISEEFSLVRESLIKSIDKFKASTTKKTWHDKIKKAEKYFDVKY